MPAGNLERVAELSAIFKHAVAARYGADCMVVADRIIREAVDADPQYIIRRTGATDECSASKIIRANMTAILAVHHRGTSKSVHETGARKVARLVPDELKSEENVAILRSMGADQLVALCTRPAPRERKFLIFKGQ
jgi:hypothetical protein